MSRPFLVVFPKEIRDQIYRYILTSTSGSLGISPWDTTVAKSLTILQTCKQVHREVKDVIWAIHGLRLRECAQIEDTFKSFAVLNFKALSHVRIDLEIMDRDELQWIARGLKFLSAPLYTGTLQSVTLRTIWEKPRDVKEYKEVLMLRKYGELVDGRLFQEFYSHKTLTINTGWPRFSHWGKQKWLKQMLLDPTGGLLRELHEMFGGEMRIDGVLIFKNRIQLRPHKFDARDAEVEIIPEVAARHLQRWGKQISPAGESFRSTSHSAKRKVW